MNPWSVAAWAAAFAAARLRLFGLVGGGLWTRRQRSVALPPAADERAALNRELDRLRRLASNLELELQAQRAHCFALESDMEARESAWARVSPTPLAFDSQTFQIDHHTPADVSSSSSAVGWVDTDAANSAHGSLYTPSERVQSTPTPPAENGEAMDDEPTQWRHRTRWPQTRSITATAAIEGLARRIEAIQNSPPAQHNTAARQASR